MWHIGHMFLCILQSFKVFFFVACGVYMAYLLLLILRAYSELRAMPYFGESSIKY